jgi:hypothetical protein
MEKTPAQRSKLPSRGKGGFGDGSLSRRLDGTANGRRTPSRRKTLRTRGKSVPAPFRPQRMISGRNVLGPGSRVREQARGGCRKPRRWRGEGEDFGAKHGGSLGISSEYRTPGAITPWSRLVRIAITPDGADRQEENPEVEPIGAGARRGAFGKRFEQWPLTRHIRGGRHRRVERYQCRSDLPVRVLSRRHAGR